MNIKYKAIFTDLGNGLIYVRLPDLDVGTQGYGYEDACMMVKDLLKIMIEEYTEANKEMPTPTDLDYRTLEENQTIIEVEI